MNTFFNRKSKRLAAELDFNWILHVFDTGARFKTFKTIIEPVHSARERERECESNCTNGRGSEQTKKICTEILSRQWLWHSSKMFSLSNCMQNTKRQVIVTLTARANIIICRHHIASIRVAMRDENERSEKKRQRHKRTNVKSQRVLWALWH